MLKSYKIILLLLPLLVFTDNAFSEEAEKAKAPIKLETKMKSEKEKNAIEVFNPIDNSPKFRINPKELSVIKAMDAKTLKEKIESVKDQVLDAKSKLIEITKEKFSADTPLSYLSIQHKNRMGSRYSLINLTYILDGKKIFADHDLYKSKKDIYSVYNGFVAPGHHEVVVEAVYSGNGEGVFDYLADYRITTQKKYQFVVPDAKKIYLEGSGYESGSIFTSFKARPAIEFNKRIEDKIAENIEK